MRIVLPNRPLSRALSNCPSMTVVRFNKEVYIVTGSQDPIDTDFRSEGSLPDTICLNIQTGKVEMLAAHAEVEVLDSELIVKELLVGHNGALQHGLTQAEIFECRAGRKILAIKMVRERTGLGLKEAKDLVDAEFPALGM